MTVINRLLNNIEATPWLIWQLLTKRPENILSLIQTNKPDWLTGQFPYNIWIGTSVENQGAADKRIPYLMEVPAKFRFLSMEPLLGDVDLNRVFMICKHWMASGGDPNLYGKYWWKKQSLVLANWEPPIHWVIVGGESGRHARPIHPDWVRSIRDQCQAAEYVLD